MITGTSHFISRQAAFKYYRPYLGDPVFKGTTTTQHSGVKRRYLNEEAHDLVVDKIAKKEIFIGKPELKSGQKLLINREEGRYFIQEQPQTTE